MCSQPVLLSLKSIASFHPLPGQSQFLTGLSGPCVTGPLQTFQHRPRLALYSLLSFPQTLCMCGFLPGTPTTQVKHHWAPQEESDTDPV